MRRSPVVRNAAITVLQVVASSATFFVLYLYILRTLGPESLGLWSLVLATTALSRLSELGLTGSALKFVAQHLAREDTRSVVRVVETAALTILTAVGVLILLLYPLMLWLLRINLEAAPYQQAVVLLPYALTSFLVNSVSGVLGSALEGYQRFDLRAYCQTGGHLLYLAAAVALIPRFELEGLAVAQLLQASAVVPATWILLRRCCPALPLLPHRWSGASFRELFGYGFQFQVSALMLFLCDPATKLLLARFGGLSLTAHYEMASRLVLQLRALMVSANRVLIPVFAEFQELAPQRIVSLYRSSLALLFYLSLPAYGLLLAAAPMISIVWIGRLEMSFALFCALLCLAWLINTLTAPAYIANLGLGRLRWNTVAHVFMALANLVLGVALGALYGGTGVVVGWALALALGSLVIAFSYQAEQGIPWSAAFSPADGGLVFAVLTGAAATWASFFYLRSTAPVTLLLVLVLAYPLIVALPVWRHPQRKRLVGLIFANQGTSSTASSEAAN